MTQLSSHPVCPFVAGTRRPDEPYPGREALRAAGPVVLTEAPAGGPVAIVTTAALARAVLADPRIVKDTALAPASWGPRAAGLEPTRAQALSLTTAEGEPHAALRRAHAPMLSPRRVRARQGAMRDAARELLADAGDAAQRSSTPRGPGPVDLVADFTTRYPLVVVGDLLGVPRAMLDDAVDACRRMWGDAADGAAAMGAFARLGAAATAHDGLARELRERLPATVTDDELHYLLFTLIFAGQLTTDAALGFLVARLLVEGPPRDTVALVDDVLRRDPPAPFSLWRFTAEQVELGGAVLAPGTPVLVDLAGTADDPDAGPGAGLAFGAGPHVCAGIHLARAELAAVVDVLVADFPDARLAIPAADLRRVDPGTIGGSRLAALPVEGLSR